jgi:hypothetical protein
MSLSEDIQFEIDQEIIKDLIYCPADPNLIITEIKVTDWVITIPKSISWIEYQLELQAAADGAILNYHTRYLPKEMKVDDRCFIVWDGYVRGWMKICGLIDKDKPWVCTTTGINWPPGKYIQRTGKFYHINGPEMLGFRGIRKFNG